ncbi:MAG TPA: tetratricopeptide repeat protein [Vicinamibacterales bacterium]|nr:tetratricopeptide repeat protein [Vicinamibacterales bacterium]
MRKALARLLVASVVLWLAGPVRAQEPWDTNKLVNEAHGLGAAELEKMRTQADMGDPRAQVLVGLAYEMGAANLMPNPSLALSWFLKAADQGVPWAQVWAGDFYYTGSPGVPRDLDRALGLYRSAADKGDPRAAFFVGRMYFFGDGVRTDLAEAGRWFERAEPAQPDVVQPMVALATTGCDSPACVALKQIVGAMVTKSADRYLGDWDDVTREWDAAMSLPDFERCGFTSADQSEKGDIENYFCDSQVIGNVAEGNRAAARVVDDVARALPGWQQSPTTSNLGPAVLFSRAGGPRIRVSYNITPGDAPRRVTLLVGP